MNSPAHSNRNLTCLGVLTYMAKIAAGIRFSPRFSSKNARAFTLVEVVISLGIFSFAFLSVAGLMAAGLSTVKNSSSSQAITNINRSLRASLQALPFTNFALGSSTTYYFTESGYSTTVTNTSPNAPFYKAVLTAQTTTYPAVTGVSANACNISATISYPYPVNALSITNSYFVAQ